VAGLVLLALPFVAGRLIVSLEHGLPLTASAADPPQAIVILSAEVSRSGGDAPRIGIGPLTLERVRAGAALYRRTGLPILVTGGAPQDAPDASLAGMMARSLDADFHVPVRWIEPAAQDTWENAADSAAILKAQGIGSIYLVTHAWHMRRALIAFRHTGIRVTAAPVQIDHAPGGRFSDFVPRTSAWLTSYYALHEWIGCADYALLR
jgi:uncharacterized SAM-binding protein YcdF (DUF218 family)